MGITKFLLLVGEMLGTTTNVDNISLESSDEAIEAEKETAVANNQLCVCNACVTCTTSIPGTNFIHVVKNGKQVEIGNLGELDKADIFLSGTFVGCKKTSDNQCTVDVLDIEDREWKMPDKSKSQGEEKENLNYKTSYMICTKGPGIIYFINAGQTTKACMQKTLQDYIEIKEFENELRAKGFPEGYIKYLLPLHEKYPNWKFEAVITNVDYQEFLKYQIDNQIKCALKQYVNYCTKILFKKEKSGDYNVASDEAIRFFSHPYSMLKTGSWNYENALQFLRGDQELPQEYSEQVVSALLRNKETEVIDAIVNSNSCINPAFMASIYVAENGPVGKLYKGREVYNLFNVGADGGGDDALEYAYEHDWFTIEACINGSEETFQSYLDRGQNTLYALDWDFQSFSKGEDLHQYATAVNDAEDKALNLVKKDGNMFDLDYELVLSIPVYENIPTYNEEPYAAFPDPNRIARGLIE